jgi:hypothetical protein
MLKHSAANKKRRLSALPNLGPYMYEVEISGFTMSAMYIYIYICTRQFLNLRYATDPGYLLVAHSVFYLYSIRVYPTIYNLKLLLLLLLLLLLFMPGTFNS